MNNNGGAAGNDASNEGSPRRGPNTPRGSSPRRRTTELALFTPPWSAAPPAQHCSGSGGLGGHAVPVGDGGSGGGGAPRVGGSLLGRKRGRDGGNEEGEGGRNYHCSVCNKAFGSARAVFGHMRKHPDRGWTGAHPPPAFRAEEEFADLPVAETLDDEEVAEEEDPNYRVPDLNYPPPPDATD